MKRFLAVGIAALLIFTAGAYARSDEKPPEQEVNPGTQEKINPENQELSQKIISINRLLAEIQFHIHSYYYRDVDLKLCFAQILAGGLAKCLDPNSSYISPEDVTLFESEAFGKFYGIGIEISLDKNGRVAVISPIEGSPAFNAGLAAGDIITHVGENENKLVAIKDLSIFEVIKLIRGPKGTSVMLRVLRGGMEKSFTEVRDEIVIVSVKKNDLAGRLGYIRVRQFQEKTFESFLDALADLRNKNSCGAVLDFRNNPGGLLETALNMADLWSKKVGDVFIVEKFRGQEAEVIGVIEPLGEFRNFPVVILVNKGSTSGSEVFAGILQDWGHPVVGTKTFGKGTVQTIIPLQSGGILRLTTREYFVGNAKKPVHEVGITPDHVVENPETKLSDDPIEWNKILKRVDPQNDPQLKKALEVLESRTAQCRGAKAP